MAAATSYEGDQLTPFIENHEQQKNEKIADHRGRPAERKRQLISI
jgi:hypothetical protein